MRVAIAMLVLFSTSTAMGAVKTWTGGGGNTNWTTTANWSAAVSASDDLVFPDGIAAGTTNSNDFPAATSFNSISFAKNGTGNQSYSLGGNSIMLGVGGVTDNDTMGTRTLTMAIQLTSNTTVTTAGSLNLDGIISGAFGLTKAGAGTLSLHGANTYSGVTTVSAGQLFVNGLTTTVGAVVVTAGELGISSGATTGNIVLNGGTLFPGDGGLGNGNSGSLGLSATGTVKLILNDTVSGTYSHINVTGAIGLGDADLVLLGGATPAVGTSWVIFANDGADAVTGTFKNLSEGSTIALNGVPLRISYKGGDGNDVTLTAVNAVTESLASSKTGPAIATEPVTFTATVTGAASPSGMVTFYDGAAMLGAAALASGTAAFTTSLLSVGMHSIEAHYEGDATHAGFAVALDQAVIKAESTIALSVDSSGTALQAQLGPVAPATGVPSGMVSIKEGATVLDTQPINSTGLASFSSSAIGLGKHTLTAAYEGDDNFTGSTSASAMVELTAAATDGGTDADGGTGEMMDDGGCSHAGHGATPIGLVAIWLVLGAMSFLARRSSTRS